VHSNSALLRRASRRNARGTRLAALWRVCDPRIGRNDRDPTERPQKEGSMNKAISLHLPLVAVMAAALLLAAVPAATADDASALWSKNCASCHGQDGKGKTKMGEKLKVRDLTDAAVKAKLDKTKVEDSMKKGVKGDEGDKLVMKAFSDKLSDADIKALTDYTLSLK
jgi:cytochrome c553